MSSTVILTIMNSNFRDSVAERLSAILMRHMMGYSFKIRNDIKEKSQTQRMEVTTEVHRAKDVQEAHSNTIRSKL